MFGPLFSIFSRKRNPLFFVVHRIQHRYQVTIRFHFIRYFPSLSFESLTVVLLMCDHQVNPYFSGVQVTDAPIALLCRRQRSKGQAKILGRVVIGGRRTSVTFHNVITDTKHEKPLAVFLSNVIPTSTWVTFKIEAYEVLSVNTAQRAWRPLGTRVTSSMSVSWLSKAMCLPLVAYLLVALTRSFSEFSGAFAEIPFTKKIHGNGRIWREWRPSAL